MKTIWLLFVFAISVATACAAEKEVRGVGIVTVDGIERQLSMTAYGDHVSTNQLDPQLPVMNFQALPLKSALTLYGNLKKRTLLIHPQLGTQTFSLKMNPRTQEEAVEAWEKLFHEQNIATIPDGEHFVMVVPYSQTNTISPKADSLPKTNALLPEMSINFQSAPDQLAIQTYADFVQKQIVNLNDSSWYTCCNTVTFVQITPLSREEICYALKTLIEWHNIRMVPEGGNRLKLERINAR
jgi:hypothetical protein